jgi:hypothetical protein
MYILQQFIDNNYNLSSLDTYTEDIEFERTILIFNFLEPFYKNFLIDFNIYNKNEESFYNVALHTIVVNLGRGDNHQTPYFTPDINQDNDYENDDIESIYELIDYFLPSLKNFDFFIEKQLFNESQSINYLKEIIYYQNEKNRIEKIHVSTIKKVAQNLLEIEIHKCVNILQCYLNQKIDINDFYGFYGLDMNSEIDDIERVENIICSVLNKKII